MSPLTARSPALRPALLALCLSISPAAPAAEQGLTEKTGQEILKELRGIRQALERNQAPAQPAVAQRVTVSVAGAPALGDAKAPITVVEFTDYQCPYCKKFSESTFPEIKKNYIDTGKVRFVTRNLPLAFHKQADTLAQAALCAGDQGKFWEMRESLFRNNQFFDATRLTPMGQELGLDMNKFDECLKSGKHAALIARDTKEAQGAGITGTPTFVIGKTATGEMFEGEKLVGAQPFGAFEVKFKGLLK